MKLIIFKLLNFIKIGVEQINRRYTPNIIIIIAEFAETWPRDWRANSFDNSVHCDFFCEKVRSISPASLNQFFYF